MKTPLPLPNAEVAAAYHAAVAHEARVREDAFCEEPRALCGVEVRPLTLRDFERLQGLRSPFVVGGRIERADVALLLWHQRYAPTDEDPQTFAARLDTLNILDLLEAVDGFVSDALMDAPKAHRKAGQSPPCVALSASVIHRLCNYYRTLTPREVRDMPLAQLWQYMRMIQQDQGSCPINPLSDRVKSTWLASVQPPEAPANEPDAGPARPQVAPRKPCRKKPAAAPPPTRTPATLAEMARTAANPSEA